MFTTAQPNIDLDDPAQALDPWRWGILADWLEEQGDPLHARAWAIFRRLALPEGDKLWLVYSRGDEDGNTHQILSFACTEGDHLSVIQGPEKGYLWLDEVSEAVLERARSPQSFLLRKLCKINVYMDAVAASINAKIKAEYWDKLAELGGYRP